MRLLMIDDDEAFARVMVRRLEHHGWQAFHCSVASDAFSHHANEVFEVILLDLNLQGESGLKHLDALQKKWPQARIIILTGYASIATTVHAIKNGAVDYLTKPIEMSILLKAIAGEEEAPELSDEPVGVDTLEWEMIQRALQEHDGNISATARALKMHRRTLQRRLQKRRC
ncbi:two-component system response regulator [Aliidiomarina shirensis]|uniref:Two-component system response regulator n=1 Tax=Aliidiomarina shirensis TaxID=1048642 RepID=A0A432WQF9_9GAMM|nr:response regulator [Aliidiomarina shirensis]RUO36010.1 two-component system response regulator [Aliidiomarina shirensis]